MSTKVLGSGGATKIKAAQTYIPGTTDQTIPSGVLITGIQTIKGDADLTSANILDGKDIFGVIGNVVKDPFTILSPGTFANIYYFATEIATVNATYTPIGKNVKVLRSGTIRISFKLRCTYMNRYQYARVYKNGVAVGTERAAGNGSGAAAESTFSQDFNVAAGDIFTIYQRSAEGTYGGGVSNFTISIDNSLPAITQEV